VAWHRILVNANKFVTSLAATRVVRRGIETLGGNGTIEDFSPLPRLYRDAIVFESWEGTHNVLCMQVLRDLGRLDALPLVIDRVRAVSDAGIIAEALQDLERRVDVSIAMPQHGARHVRRQLDTLVRTLQIACLLREKAPSAELLIRRHLTRGWDPESDTGYGEALDAVIGDDA
jgi:hypothetical protein